MPLRARLLLHVLCSGLAVLAVPSSALARATPLARLVYMRGPGAEQCPQQMELRMMVIARLGYDPFSATASRVVLAKVERTGDELRAKVDLANADGSIEGVRELSAPAADCSALMRALALSISIAIDPSGALVKREAGPTSEAAGGSMAPPEAESTEALPARASQPLSQQRSLRYFTGAGLHLTYGAAPALGYGGDLIVGSRYRDFSLSLEGRADPMVMTSSGVGGEIGAMFMLASLVPCAHWRMLAFCGLGSAGFMRASSQYILVSSSQTGAYAAAGARVSLQWPIAERFQVAIHGDLATPLPRRPIQIYEIEANGRETAVTPWPAPALFGLIGMNLVVYY